MGDARFAHPLRRVLAAADRPRAIRELRDEEVVEALAASSRQGDPYLANVLATEALNRLSRKTAIVESAAQGLLTLDLEGRILYANPAAESMADAAAGGLSGRAAGEYLRPDAPSGGEAATAADGVVEAALAEGATAGLQMGRFGSDTGGWRRVEWTLSPLVRRGEHEGHVLTVTDVSARERAEQELAAQREVQALLLQVQDDLQEGVLLLEGARVAHVNQSFLALLARPRERLRTVDDVLACVEPEERAAFQARLAAGISRTQADGPHPAAVQRFELTLRPDGNRRVVADALLEHVRRGNGVTTALVLRDVTLRRFVGQAVRTSERELRAAFTHADAALALLDPAGRWLRVNEPACDLLCTTMGRLRPEDWKDAFAPAHRQKLSDAFRRCLERGAAAVQVRARDAGSPPLELRLRLVRDDTGGPAYIVALLSTMTHDPTLPATAPPVGHPDRTAQRAA